MKRKRMEFKWDMSQLPGWVVAVLEEDKIPSTFILEELSTDQKYTILMIEAFLKLEKKGILKIWYEPGKGVMVDAVIEKLMKMEK